MNISIHPDKLSLGEAAASKGAELINEAIRNQGEACIVVATGASQFEMLKALTGAAVDWQRVTAFHLDEYIGLPGTHPASFRRYLKERFAGLVPLKKFHYINGESDPEKECSRLGQLLNQQHVDVAFIGIGENGHLAFNDPPADFSTTRPFLVVELDKACRMQQYGEGWFPSPEAVPTTAISMSVNQIMKSGSIICTVPDERKARAVKNALEGRLSPEVPASILSTHKRLWMFLDRESSSMLKNRYK